MIQSRRRNRSSQDSRQKSGDGAARNPNWTLLANEINAWRDEVGTDPQTTEQLISPVEVDTIVSSERGERERPNADATANHPGADLRPVNREIEHIGVRAAMSGRVLFAGEFNNLLGQAIFVGADNGEIHVYGHLRDMNNDDVDNPAAGTRVHQGERIGIMGRSGNTTGRCLHFVIRRPPPGVSTEAYLRDVLAQDFGDDQVAELIARAQADAELRQQRDAQLRVYSNYELVDAVVDGRRFSLGAHIPAGPAAPRAPDIQVASAGLVEAGATLAPTTTAPQAPPPFAGDLPGLPNIGGLIER